MGTDIVPLADLDSVSVPRLHREGHGQTKGRRQQALVQAWFGKRRTDVRPGRRRPAGLVYQGAELSAGRGSADLRRSGAGISIK